MRSTFDRRVVSDAALDFIRECQARVPCHLGGGAALAGAYLAHRRSRDLDLFCHDSQEQRALVAQLEEIAHTVSASLRLQRDGGAFVRAELALPEQTLIVDVVHEPQQDLEAPPPAIESVIVESLLDLRASKLTCLLSRSEPRDLVDVLFLERAGFAPENDLPLALRKDAGVDPGILAWLLKDFTLEPLPEMLEPLAATELRSYRDALAQRLRQLSFPPVIRP